MKPLHLGEIAAMTAGRLDGADAVVAHVATDSRALAALDPATRARIAAEQAGSAYGIADKLGFDDVIDPRDLRNALIAGLALTEGRRGEPLGPTRLTGITP